MSRISTNNSEGIFSRMPHLAELLKGWEMNDDHHDQSYRDDVEIKAIQRNPRVGSATFTIGFGEAFWKIGRRESALYFYPGDLRGLIESCVLATQRVNSVIDRDIGLYHELESAMEIWLQREEEAEYKRTGTFRSGSINMKRRELDKAVQLAGIIDDIVLEKMGVIQDAFGEFSVDPHDFIWNNGTALTMTVYY